MSDVGMPMLDDDGDMIRVLRRHWADQEQLGQAIYYGLLLLATSCWGAFVIQEWSWKHLAAASLLALSMFGLGVRHARMLRQGWWWR